METEMKAEDTAEDTERTNVVMNIGMTTKEGVKLNVNSAMDKIGAETDCTITNTVGFYHGKREISLRVDIYDIEIDRAISMAGYFAHIFQQKCVALTVGNKTVFVNGDYTEEEFLEWCDTLAK